MNLPDDWREFIELLNSAGVEYVVVGGHAVGYHGYPRYTGDIDFFVRPSAKNAQRLVGVLSGFGFEGAAELTNSLQEPDKIVQLGRPPNRIDLLTSISGVAFDQAAEGCTSADLGGVEVRILGRKELLINKHASGRTKDLADAEQIEATGADEA